MANTTNLDLVKPLGTDHALISQINGNMEKIDVFAGNTNSSLNSLADGLAVISVGDTHAAISSGQFVYVKGHNTLSEGLYVATANIAANGALSGSNLTADSAGGLNALNSKMVSKEVKLNLGSAYSSGWVSDFLNLPSVTTRALFTIYNASQAEWMNGMKRESDQNIAISNVQTALQNQTIYVTGIFK